jgi:geranylgeranyl diphosphate synthase type II
METYQDIQRRIEQGIAALTFDAPPAALFAPIAYTLASGGKRLRPALTLMACNLYGDDLDAALPTALAMEVFHNFTLLHDDLMDAAPLRRGRPTVHARWGANAAILSGDAMLVAAYRLLARTPAAHLPSVLEAFNETALDVCRGQQYDMDFESRDDVTEDDYMEMIRLKTAVLPACCLRAGAIVGGAGSDDVRRIDRFGIHLGMAFQLQDDLLDVYGDARTFGKAIGGDILAGKKTFLLTSARRRATPAQVARLDEALASTEPDQKIAAVTHLYDELGLRPLTGQLIRSHYADALACLDALACADAPHRTDALRRLCHSLLERQA